MQVEYTGRQVTVTASHRRVGDEGIERIVKLLPKLVDAHIVLTTEKYRKTADVTLRMRAGKIVGFAESSNMETALREALGKAESQAIRWRKKMNTIKRQPKEEKMQTDNLPVRARKAARSREEAADAEVAATPAPTHRLVKTNGKRPARQVVPVTVHTFPAKSPIAEPHIVRSADSVALRPMTVEEAVKEAEFRDRDVFVFRTNEGTVCVLHRKRDGKMELIEAP